MGTVQACRSIYLRKLLHGSCPITHEDKREEVVGCLKWLTSNQQRMTRVIGVAAHAADILAPQARNMRVSDFKNIARTEPVLRKFNEVELACIGSIDRKVAIA